MKKLRLIISFLLICMLMTGALSGCGAKEANDASFETSSFINGEYDASGFIPDLPMEKAEEAEAADMAADTSKITDFSEKLIYTANAEIETRDFATSLDILYNIVND